MTFIKNCFLLLLFIAVNSCSSLNRSNNTFSWQEKSHLLAKDYIQSFGDVAPEYASWLGFSEFDAKVSFYSKDYDQRRREHHQIWKKRISDLLSKAQDKNYATDLRILLGVINLESESLELDQKLGVIPFVAFSEHIFLNLKKAKVDNNPKSFKDALSRFHLLINGDEKGLPLVDGIVEYTENKITSLSSGQKGLWPWKKEIEIYLKNEQIYVNAVEELFSSEPEYKWRDNFRKFKVQAEKYKKFITQKILPKARYQSMLPKEKYAFLLRDYGMNKPPEELIRISKKDFELTFKKFQTLAEEIAKDKKLSQNDPLSVVKFLGNKKIMQAEELLKAYKSSMSDLYGLIKDKDLINLKKAPNIIIRLASNAEAQSLPAPHFISSPLVGDKRESPSEFVITPFNQERDDFSYPEAILNLTAHEALPGHGLQYQVMKERQTTLIRARLGFNSANVEGWALYAEDMIYPFISKEAQFITLQRKLWRQARMFLDPQLNLGLITADKVREVFVNQLGFSESFAQSEIDRYSYIIPAQAPSYYFGYLSLMNIKRDWKNRDVHLTDKCFNDAILNLGVLPFDEIKVYIQELNCQKSI